MNAVPQVQVWLHYPSVPSQRRPRRLALRAEGITGITQDRRFQGIVQMASDLAEYLVAESPLALGPKMKDTRDARRSAKTLGVPLLLSSELQYSRVRDLLRDARVQQVLIASIPNDVRVDVFPTSVCTDPHRAEYFHSFALPGRWVMHIPDRVDESVLAHELGHAALYYEDYPTLVARYDSPPMSSSRWECSMSDVEVDRRVAAYGLDMHSAAEAALFQLAYHNNIGHIAARDPHALAQEYVHWSLWRSSRTEWRDQALRRIENEFPADAELGRAVLNALGSAVELQTEP